MNDVESIRRTLADPLWRLSRLYFIVNKAGQKIRFAPNAIQKLVNAEPAYRKMVLKARQFGISTGEILKQLDHTMFHRNVTSCILAHEQDSIEKLFRIVHRAYGFMHPDLKPKLARGGGSKYEMFFPEINSRIYCDLESRSDTIQWLHVSEAAFMDPGRLGATLQTVPLKTGRVTVETTANGMGNHFYDMWTDPASPYKKLFYPWFLFPDYAVETPKLTPTAEEREFIAKAKKHFDVRITYEQLAFRRMKQAELKTLGTPFMQEYPEDDQSCFLASGSPAIDLVAVKKLLDELRPPLSDDGSLRIYEKYDRNKRYVCGADTSEGVSGGDYSTGQMFEVGSRRQVASLHGRWKPSEFAELLVEFCMMYHAGGRPHPQLAVERNNHGHAVLLQLENLSYPHIYVHTDDRPGWLTDRVTRPIMIDTFIDGVENRSLELRDEGTLRECLTLVDADGKIEAARGKNDDRVVACAIAIQVCIKSGGVLDIYENIGEKIKT